MPAKIAVKRPAARIPLAHAIYDLSEPFCGCSTILVMHRREANWIYEVRGVRAGRLLANHPGCDIPDETMRELGYWVTER